MAASRYALLVAGALLMPAVALAAQPDGHSEPGEVTELADWLRSSGAFIHPCLQVEPCRSGRCLFTACALQPHQPLVVVAPELQVRPMTPPVGPAVCSELHPAGQELLALKLLEERSRGRGGRQWRWLRTLPLSFPDHVTEEDAQRACVAGTAAEARVGQRFAQRQKQYGLLRKCAPHVVPGTAVDDAALHWALSTVSTRSFTFKRDNGSSILFVPFADMVNDAQSATADWDFDATSGNFRLLAGNAMLPPGAEVVISYGHKSNEQLLTKYGFVHDNNPNDVAFVDLSGLIGTTAKPVLPLSVGDKAEGVAVREGAADFRDMSVFGNLRSMSILRRHHIRAGTSKRQAEDLVLSAVRDRCASAAEIWGHWEGIEGSCADYRASHRALALGCVGFADAALVQIRGPCEDYTTSLQPPAFAGTVGGSDVTDIVRRSLIARWVATPQVKSLLADSPCALTSDAALIYAV